MPSEAARTRGLQALTPAVNQADRARDALKDAIVAGELAAGELYSVQRLSELLGLSRTPVREALIQISRQGLVQFERNRGVRVVSIGREGLRDIFELRLWIEVPAVMAGAKAITAEGVEALRREYAAMSAAAAEDDRRALWAHDLEFHDVLLHASGNLRASSYIATLRDLLVVHQLTTLESGARAPRSVVEAHLPILNAVEAGDPELVGLAVRRHLEVTRDLLLAHGEAERALA